jgi:hypothetical protein
VRQQYRLPLEQYIQQSLSTTSKKIGVLTMNVTETYADANMRDHMKGIHRTPLGMATTHGRLHLTGSSEDNDSVEDVPSFARDVIRDPTRALQAQMTIKLPSAVHQNLQNTAMAHWEQ